MLRIAKANARALALTMACGAALPALAQSPEPDRVLEGEGAVIDADVLRVGRERVILWGIDAPERLQMCAKDGQPWDCYGASLRMLETYLGRGEITCYLLGEPDPLGRRYGVCEQAGEVINAEMVRAGLAMAFTEQSDDYIPEQLDAIDEAVGIWQFGVQFIEPWVFRETRTPGNYR